MFNEHVFQLSRKHTIAESYGSFHFYFYKKMSDYFPNCLHHFTLLQSLDRDSVSVYISQHGVLSLLLLLNFISSIMYILLSHHRLNLDFTDG